MDVAGKILNNIGLLLCPFDILSDILDTAGASLFVLTSDLASLFSLFLSYSGYGIELKWFLSRMFAMLYASYSASSVSIGLLSFKESFIKPC